MFSHVHIGVADFERAFAFYEKLLSELGLVLKFSEPENGWAGWQMPDQDRPLFVIGKPFDGNPANAGNGHMTAFLATSRAAVDACYAAAIAAGATDEGKPGLRPHYHQHYYGAYFRDLDGNKLCVCCHTP